MFIQSLTEQNLKPKLLIDFALYHSSAEFYLTPLIQIDFDAFVLDHRHL